MTKFVNNSEQDKKGQLFSKGSIWNLIGVIIMLLVFFAFMSFMSMSFTGNPFAWLK